MSASELQLPPARTGLTDAATSVVESRGNSRVALDLRVHLQSSETAGPLEARTRDISLGGVCVATRYAFAFRSVQRVDLELPQGALALATDGRWQADSPSEESFLTGFAFVDPKSEAESALWRLVQHASESIASFLYESSELSVLGTDDVMGVAQVSRLRMVNEDRPILQQDERGPGDDSVFVVLRGRVEILFRSRPDAVLRVAELCPGSIFGGMPIIADLPNMVGAVALEDSELLEISGPAYAYLRLAKPLVAQRLAQVVARSSFKRVRALVDATRRRRLSDR